MTYIYPYYKNNNCTYLHKNIVKIIGINLFKIKLKLKRKNKYIFS